MDLRLLEIIYIYTHTELYEYICIYISYYILHFEYCHRLLYCKGRVGTCAFIADILKWCYINYRLHYVSHDVLQVYHYNEVLDSK